MKSPPAAHAELCMQQCRALQAATLADDDAETTDADKLRLCIRELYSDISEHELEVLIESYKAFTVEYQENCGTVCREPATTLR